MKEDDGIFGQVCGVGWDESRKQGVIRGVSTGNRRLDSDGIEKHSIHGLSCGHHFFEFITEDNAKDD